MSIGPEFSTLNLHIDQKILQELKLKFYELMIQLDQHESEYLKICKHFRAIYDTNSIQEDSEKKKEVHFCSYERIILCSWKY